MPRGLVVELSDGYEDYILNNENVMDVKTLFALHERVSATMKANNNENSRLNVFVVIILQMRCYLSRLYYLRGWIVFLLQQKGMTVSQIAEELKVVDTTVYMTQKWFYLCRDYPKFLYTTKAYTICAKDSEDIRKVIILMQIIFLCLFF